MSQVPRGLGTTIEGATVKKVSLALLALVIAVLVAPSPARADSHSRQDRLDQQVEDLRHQYRESSATAVAAFAAASRADASLVAAQAELAVARARLGDARAQEQIVADKLTAAQQEEQSATLRLQQTEQVLTQAEVDLGRFMRGLYVEGPLTPLSSLLEAKSLTDLTRQMELNDLASDLQGDRVTLLATAKADLAIANAVLAQRRSALQQLERDAIAAVTAKRDLETEAARAATRASKLARASRTALTRAQSMAADDEASYREMDAEADRLRAYLKKQARQRAASAGDVATAAGRAGMIWPVIGPITSPFGMRTHPVTGEYKLHTGLDIGSGCGTPIRAALSGTVLSADFNAAYGYRTVIRDGLSAGVDVTTTYNHQQGLGVSPGQSVSKGDTIGWVGTTGYSTGCHLHFEVLANGAFVDPQVWLP